MKPGLSSLIGLKAAALLSLFLLLRFFGFKLLSFPFLHAALVSLSVSIASLPSIILPLLLGKKSDGTFPIWAILVFGPFLFFVRFLPSLRGLYRRDDPCSEICEGHGTSVAVTFAVLVALGEAEIIKEKRACIRMNSSHRKALEEWSKRRLSGPK